MRNARHSSVTACPRRTVTKPAADAHARAGEADHADQAPPPAPAPVAAPAGPTAARRARQPRPRRTGTAGRSGTSGIQPSGLNRCTSLRYPAARSGRSTSRSRPRTPPGTWPRWSRLVRDHAGPHRGQAWPCLSRGGESACDQVALGVVAAGAARAGRGTSSQNSTPRRRRPPPSTKNACRQPMRGGQPADDQRREAPPRRADIQIAPWAKARSRYGNQSPTTRVEVGVRARLADSRTGTHQQHQHEAVEDQPHRDNQAAWPPYQVNRRTQPGQGGEERPARATIRVSTRRGPQRSPIQPPGTSKSV